VGASEQPFDLIVIGSGPGGYVGAIRAAQLGMRVACVERDPALGGTCLRIGCIPSKALLEATHKYHEAKHGLGAFGIRIDPQAVTFDLPAMLDRKDRVVSTLTQGIAGLFKKHKITRFHGHASFSKPNGSAAIDVEVSPPDAAASGPGQEAGAPIRLQAKSVLIATGSVESRLRGVDLDGAHVGTSTDALRFDSVPKRLLVIGAGAIGLELGSVWSRLGSEVQVVEYAPRILVGMDSELASTTQRLLAKQGLRFLLGAQVSRAAWDPAAKTCRVELADKDPLEADRVLLAVGRVPTTQDLGLENLGIDTDRRGCIPVDPHFATKVPGVYAIGDVIAGPMLAHKAEDEAVACVEGLATGYGHVDYDAIPYVVYTHPEVAAVGQTEDALKEKQHAYRRGTFPFSASARARAVNQTDGLVKVLADAKTDRILGVHIVGPHAGELIAEAATCISFKASSEDLARSCHAHPTLAEAVREACLAVDGRSLNM
jgi:dihydrolipoamide dehydrogenase